jgi:hypothetical protein
MSNLFAINGSTKRQKGGGLLVYENKDHIFSNENKGFNDSIGLWDIPTDRTPTFQIWVPYAVFVSFRYLETKGKNNFTGVFFVPPVGSVALVASVLDDGTQKYIYQSSDDFTFPVPCKKSRWVGELIIGNSSADIATYYTEEFTTFNCCP